jgi:hypothetical protein
MENRFVGKAFIYFLCVSFLLLTNGFHMMAAEAKGMDRPIGEMISSGEVKFEARDKVWKNVDPSHFPIFQGVKIKIENGKSILALANSCQIEVGQNSLLTFDQNDRLHLVQGTIDFRVPATAAMEFKVGNLFISPSRPLQASKSPSAVLPKMEEVTGSILIHSNGAVTVKSMKGSLSILSQDRVVLASLSPRDSVTIPSVTVKSPSRMMVAQAGETGAGAESEKSEFLGLSPWWWIGIGSAAAVGIIIGATAGHHGGGGHGFVPICP